ncbi:MAG: TfoX/Sxy family protein [Thermoplasmata archaeon]|nr:TfoX/Sxy family protein [Thermoplasmata archaeon]
MGIPKPAPATVAAFEALLPRRPGVTRRPVFGQPAAFVGGNMFFCVFGSELIVRLSEADRASAAKDLQATPFEPMPGRPMREYVALPEAVWKDSKRAAPWVARSIQYAAQLPAKRPKSRT